MPETSVPDLLVVLHTFRRCFSQPSFSLFVTLALGWILTPGRHAVTAALVVTGMSARRHHSAFHRFFSSARWSPDGIGMRLFHMAAKRVGDDRPVGVVVDDTLVRRKGRRVFGLGTHIDPVRSTRGHRLLCFGHVWVVVAVVVDLPCCRRPWAIPVLLRMYRSKKACAENGWTYAKKTELCRQMLDVLARWAGDRRVEVAADSAYCNATVAKDLPANLVLFGSMRPDAALTAQPTGSSGCRGGRPRVRGRRLPSPQQVHDDPQTQWLSIGLHLYRRHQAKTFCSWKAQWYRVCAGRLVRVVVVLTDNGTVPFRVFFCTDPDVEVGHLLQRYASRWSIEVAFFDLKQYLGFGDSVAWSKRAVERTAPFAAYLYGIIVLWFATAAQGSVLDVWPVRPWYRTKQAPSFPDMLGAAQRAAMLSEVFDPASNSNNLHNPLGLDDVRRALTSRDST